MKKALQTLLLLIFFISTSIAQDYLSLIEPGRLWRCTRELNSSPSDDDQSLEIYSVYGDTTINGLAYTKLYYFSTVVGFMREQEGQVFVLFEHNNDTQNSLLDILPYYWYQIEQGNEILLYDFTLEEGDVFSVGNVARTVQSVETIEINGVERKIMTIINDDLLTIEEQWIEGIGSDHGLLGPMLEEFETLWALACVQNVGEVIYVDAVIEEWPTESCSDLIAEINEQKLQRLTFSPNPASTSIEAIGVQIGDIISIQDVMGREVYRSVATNTTIQCDISTLQKGIYTIINIRDGEPTAVSQLVKQ